MPPFFAPAASAPLSDAAPTAEARAATAGTMDKASRGDHKHPRITSALTAVLNASSEAAITFTRTFATKPSWVLSYEEAADGMPVTLKVKSWVQDGNGAYTGCVVKGYRGSSIGASVTLLNLANLNLFQGSASGVAVSVLMIETSAV